MSQAYHGLGKPFLETSPGFGKKAWMADVLSLVSLFDVC